VIALFLLALLPRVEIVAANDASFAAMLISVPLW